MRSFTSRPTITTGSRPTRRSSKRDPRPPMPVLELSGDITVQDRLAYVLRRMSEMQP